MERIEEFTIGDKNFIYLDLSGVKSNEEFLEISNAFKPVFEKYPENSIYTITNVNDTRIDSETKAFLIDYMAHNKPYVKSGVVIGFDGTKKIIANSISKIVGRANMHFAFSKEQALEWLLLQD